MATQPRTIDELLREQVIQHGDKPILAYPDQGFEYSYFSLRELDALAYQAAQTYSSQISPRNISEGKPLTIALVGVSDIHYVITVLAIAKMGHTAAFLSPRLAISAYHHLLTTSEASVLIYNPAFALKFTELKQLLPGLIGVPLATPNLCIRDLPDQPYNLTPDLDLDAEQQQISWIFHSSGSTGLPKLARRSHQFTLANIQRRLGAKPAPIFLSLPLFHVHGMATLWRSITTGQVLHMYSATMPLTRERLIQAMENIPSSVFAAVPYACKLLAETEAGIKRLQDCQTVTFGGSPCPEDLGDKLTDLGVHLVSIYGSSELGNVMSSNRDRDDKDWKYLRPAEGGAEFLKFEDQGDGICELVCLDGWPTKTESNRPDGSFATKDLFVKHPTQPRWKYVGRKDDVIVLENGEKANPIPIEGGVRQHELVAEAIVFGAGRPNYGIAIIASDAALGMSDSEIIAQISPYLLKSQSEMPAYAKINNDMVLILPPNSEFPKTDKGTIIRKAFYEQYAQQISACYMDAGSEGALKLNKDEIISFLRSSIRELLALSPLEPLPLDKDFFELGFDSLQVSQLRSTILRKVDVGGRNVGANIVFDYPSLELLAEKLWSLRDGQDEGEVNLHSRIASMIEKYQPQATTPQSKKLHERECIVITGATGSLGAHLVSNLARRATVQKIYCLIRASNDEGAGQRLIESLNTRGVLDELMPADRAKLSALSSDISLPSLGLDVTILEDIRKNMTAMYHLAWKVNFNMKLESFERDCINGLKNLLDVCLSSTRTLRPRLCFCSSIGAVLGAPGNVIPEELPEFDHCQGTGYGQSKLVAEHICARVAATTDLPIYIVRIGQIIGDTKHGIWNLSEATPLMIQSCGTTGALPTIDENLKWLPVDLVAQSLTEITLTGAQSGIFNLVNPKTVHWTYDILPLMSDLGLCFEAVDPAAWVDRLRSSDQDPVKNPAMRLVEYYAARYGETAPTPREVNFDSSRASSASVTFRNIGAPSRELLTKIFLYFARNFGLPVEDKYISRE